MATGLEMYDALKEAIESAGYPSEFKVQIVESRDLRKLRTSDLMSRGYNEKVAEEASGALLKGDFGPLSEAIGVKLVISADADSLMPHQP
jgi:hypothetical protein